MSANLAGVRCRGYAAGEGALTGLQLIMAAAGRPPGCGVELGEQRYVSQTPAYAPSDGFPFAWHVQRSQVLS